MTKYAVRNPFDVDAALRLTKALSDLQRLRILMLLRPGELCVCQIVAVLALFVKALPAKGQKPGEKPEGKEKAEKPDRANAKAGGFPHEHGAAVRFKAGTLHGRGKIVARGRDGATVEDAQKRRHQVHWHEMDKDGDEDKA